MFAIPGIASCIGAARQDPNYSHLSNDARKYTCQPLKDALESLESSVTAFARTFFTRDIKDIRRETAPAHLEVEMVTIEGLDRFIAGVLCECRVVTAMTAARSKALKAKA